MNPYMDENGTHFNKLGISDSDKLEEIEYEITKNKIDEIDRGVFVPANKNYNLDRLKEIHQYLFKDVYEWAGKIRTVPSSKRIENDVFSIFADPSYFEEKWRELEKKTFAFIKSDTLNFDQKRDALVDIFVDANHIHPFPEGNGRSLQVFIKELALEQDIDLDYSKTNAKEWNNACANSGIHGKLIEEVADGVEKKYLFPYQPDIEPIKSIFANIASSSLEKQKPAFRHDINKNQAVLHVDATKNVPKNIEALQKLPGMEGRSQKDVEALAYQRGVVQERDKNKPPAEQAEKLAKFDKAALDPKFLEALEASRAEENATEHGRQRDSDEQSR